MKRKSTVRPAAKAKGRPRKKHTLRRTPVRLNAKVPRLRSEEELLDELLDKEWDLQEG